MEKNNNIRHEIEISFMTAIHGCEKELQVLRNLRCYSCVDREHEGKKGRRCIKCHGLGFVYHDKKYVRVKVSCASCNGQGVVFKTCVYCKGNGQLQKKEKVSFSIPYGIDNGMVIRVHGKGNYSLKTSQLGDLLVTVKVLPHEYFYRKGEDIEVVLPVNYSQAYFGGKVTVQTFDGALDLELPCRTQSGHTLRIPGKGVIKTGTDHQGDFLIRIVVAIPQELTQAEKSILQKMLALEKTR